MIQWLIVVSIIVIDDNQWSFPNAHVWNSFLHLGIFWSKLGKYSIHGAFGIGKQ